jgi:parvulin-like peptidyl-prolyl isomerase
VVNGAAIEREPFISALLQAHGTALLEQFVALEVAKQATRRAGIVVSKADIQDEYNRSLDLLAGQSAPHSPETATNDEKLRRQAGESLLQQVLTARNLTREIYMLIMERNAHLRMLAAQTTEITPDDLRLQYNRMHGQRVQIRHIQVMKRSDLDAAIAEYENGADMATLAVKYSLNAASAERLGLLDPFTADDPDIPALLRKTAFDMNPGDPPKPVFADGWYHWFRVEKRIPASGIPLTSCRAVVEKALRDRLTDAEMQRLHAKLMREADIRVHEPALQSKFYERFGRSASEADTSK